MVRRLLRLFVFGLAAIAALIVAALAVLETSWFRERLRVFAIERATPYLNGELSIGRLDGSLFTGVELYDVAIRQPGGDPIAADAIEIRYAPLRLWREGLAFDAIEVRAPAVRLVQEPDGGWNLANLVRQRGPSGGGATFQIDRFEITDGLVTVDTSTAEPRRLSDVNVTGGLAFEAGELALKIASLHARDDQTGFVLEDLAGSFGESFRRIDATFDGRLAEGRVAGRINGSPAAAGRSVSAVLDIERLNLADVLQRPDYASDITGRAEVNATIPDAPGSTAALQFQFRGPSASAFGYTGERVDVSGTLEDGRIAFQGRADAYGARATIDAEWQYSTPSGSGVGFRGAGTFAGASLAALPPALELPRFQSRLSGKYRLAMADGRWTADVTLAESMLEGATIADGTVGRLEARPGLVRYQASGSLRDLDVQRLAGPLEIDLLAEPRFEGRLAGTFTAIGESQSGRQHLTADASLADSSIGGARFPAMDLHVELDDRQLLVGTRGSFEGLTGQLAGLPESVPLQLNGDADARVLFRDLDAPLGAETVDVTGTVQLGPSTVRGIEIANASFAGALERGLLTLDAASVEGAELRATASGTAALGSTGESALDVSVEAADLAPLGEIVGRPLDGSATLVAKLTGPSQSPVFSGTVNARSFQYGDTASALTLDTTFEGRMPGLDRAALDLRSKVEGTFLKIRNFELVRMSGTADYAANQIAVETLLEEEARSVGLSGLVAFEPEAQRVTLRRLDVATPTATWSTPAGREARIDIDPGRISIEDLVLGQGSQALTIAGVLPFSADEPGTALEVQIADVQLADLNSLMLGTRQIQGVLSGNARVEGTLQAPVVTATLGIVNGAVEGVGFQRLQTDVTYENGLAGVDAVLDQALGARLTVAGRVPVRAPATESAAMDLRVTSTPISLGLAQPLTSELEGLTGTGVFDVNVTGSFQDPLVNGTVGISGGGFNVVATGIEYSDLNAKLNFRDNNLQIDEFSIADESGRRLQVVGGVDLTGAGAERKFNVTFMADNFAVLDNELGVMRVDALLTAAGDFARPQIFGDVRVSEGRIEVDRVLEITTSDVYSTTPIDLAEEAPAGPAGASSAPGQAPGPGESAEPGAQAPQAVPPNVAAAEAVDEAAEPEEETVEGSLMGRVDLALRIALPNNIVLRGNDIRTAGSPIGLGDMNIVAGGDITIDKDPDQSLSLVGNLEILRGYYSFQGRRFEVRPESVVSFRGGSPIDPALQVVADRLISGVTASVEVGGTVREPEIEITSKPPLDEADLLSLIIFGQPVNDLGVAQRTSLSERAASMAAGAIATPIADAVGRALNLDLFEIQSVAGEAPEVSLGSQIGTRLYVGVRQAVGRGDRSALSLEYRVADFLRFVTSIVHGAAEVHAAERREESGADLIFTWRY